MKKFLILLFVIYCLLGVYQVTKKLPRGVNYTSEPIEVAEEDVKFLYDLTFENSDGKIVSEQMIFKSIFNLIDNAQKYILMDMFLFNSFSKDKEEPYKELSGELTAKLLEARDREKNIKIDVITDPINTIYGGDRAKELDMLSGGGANVIITNIQNLRDSNPIYSSFWRIFVAWLGNSTRAGFIKHPFDGYGQRVSLRSYLSMLNFKANHRKVIMADAGEEMKSIITSANPHDGSSAHSNVALSINGDFWKEIYKSELFTANMSGNTLQETPLGLKTEKEATSTMVVRLINENQIEKSLIGLIDSTTKGDKILITMFYLSDRNIIKSLIRASDREVDIRIVLDPNKDAFGYKKNGIPNRSVAYELTKKSNKKIQIRWYDTHGEQFHSKLTMITKGKESFVVLGSANLTRRNLENYNLETDVELQANSNSVVIQDINNYFEKIWYNKDGKYYTVSYPIYKDESVFKIIMYRLQEFSGFCNF
ncbi:hypothetical protein A2331_02030 [Candidatus Falkowbacteria bacterium RIFOXYB2_FULL_34_18]|uniref:phospholipase D n=1 Tax=Candidatus Falkowbacteria bacterium RIFOXYD2_FULL_34_120 TaxID=1798007 RepID=A0A1F5TQQ8_9BACT|nr:MAG: hypothetical protein A2331_02030 [Candidatus Falkowbacteria bacterium RIFOXYB2_FULL_34_18]OGF29459.1 MAG: hypothetical protein A2500_01090 [Candidatus Falkowbacteria bacterium RIFOXYC12_FULL_34_55]OGF36772.1 MAG: hypothetical protein A2466_03400 [Candidatus Falkowbacteria bacterium RIFOXYC2_FULL_34_220]OGF38985.1 MAG: hypothetical protein A2515_05515 [Candidatus Falkowbacteria bacterium RIFOXYD12_FULL_34_57]OGF41178.1 MAG: hypothetical protein A2531_01520 [Candidatus Falkowbacteria bact